MQPIPHMTTKECDCGGTMVWVSHGFVRHRFRMECVCGRAGPWRKQPEYQKLGPPHFRDSGAKLLPIAELPPFEKAERALWGQKWTAGQADKLRDLINYGEAAGPPKVSE